MVFTGSKSRSAATSFVLSTAVLCLNIVGGLVFLPLYLKYVSPAEYGCWIAGSGIIFMLGIAEGGISTVLAMRLSEHAAKRDSLAFRATAFNGLCLSLAIGVVIVVIAAIAAQELPHLVNAPADVHSQVTSAGTVAGFACGAMVIAYSLGAIPAVLQRSFGTGITAIAAAAGQIGVTLVALEKGTGLVAFAWGVLASSGMLFVGNLYCALKASPGLFTGRYAWREAKSLLGGSRSLILTKVASAMTSQLQVPLVAHLVGPSTAGQFGIALRVSGLVGVIVDRLWNSALSGLMVSRAENETSFRSRSAQLINVSIVLIVIGFGGILLFDRELYALWLGAAWSIDGFAFVLVVTFGALTCIKNSLASLAVAAGALRWTAFVSVLECLGVFVLARVLPETAGVRQITTGFVVVALISTAVYVIKAATHHAVRQALVRGSVMIGGCAALFLTTRALRGSMPGHGGTVASLAVWGGGAIGVYFATGTSATVALVRSALGRRRNAS